MNCEICGNGMSTDGRALYRNGPKGQPSSWRCVEHLDGVSLESFKDVGEITSIISSAVVDSSFGHNEE